MDAPLRGFSAVVAMPVTKEQAQMIAQLAIDCRPIGAPRWDQAGVVAILRSLSNLHLADVVQATIRLAEDATAKTPGPLRDPRHECWRERKRMRELPHPPKSHESCRLCGRHLDSCICGEQQTRPPARVPPNDAWKQAVAELKRGSDE